MSAEHNHPYREDLAAYAIGALDTDEIYALESHLNDCRSCQSELADYQSVMIGLLQSIPSQSPPPGLRRKLAAELPSQRTRTRSLTPNIFSQFPLRQVVAVVVVVILLGINIYSSVQIRGLQREQVAIAEQLSNEQTTIAMLAYPDTQTLAVKADVKNLTGSMLVDRDKSTAVLVLWNLPPVEIGQTYQIWLIDADGNRVSGGLFTPAGEQGYTTAAIHSSVPLGDFIGLGVTVEPGGGSEGPTGPRVLAVDL